MNTVKDGVHACGSNPVIINEAIKLRGVEVIVQEELKEEERRGQKEEFTSRQ